MRLKSLSGKGQRGDAFLTRWLELRPEHTRANLRTQQEKRKESKVRSVTRIAVRLRHWRANGERQAASDDEGTGSERKLTCSWPRARSRYTACARGPGRGTRSPGRPSSSGRGNRGPRCDSRASSAPSASPAFP